MPTKAFTGSGIARSSLATARVSFAPVHPIPSGHVASVAAPESMLTTCAERLILPVAAPHP